VLRPRIIPCLLLRGKGLVKGVRFKDHTYVGDPINAVQIFNTKEADEILFLDITASAENRIPDTALVERIAAHCLTPFAVGGGIRSVADVRTLLRAGAEKVCLNTHALERPELIREIAEHFGSQSVVVSVDYRRNWLGKKDVYTRAGSRKAGMSVVEAAQIAQEYGAGEVLLNSIDRDGTQEGYDIETLKEVTESVTLPVIACGGAGSTAHLREAVKVGGASAAAAGSLFVFHGRRRAVLISFPTPEEIEQITK
jgi:imidazole glycerol-phosphate synthase subunit HisF